LSGDPVSDAAGRAVHSGSFRGVVMLRRFGAAALVLICAPAYAQHIDARKGLKFGAECVGPITTLAPKFGTCSIVGSKIRIWCPNGDVFDRQGDEANVSVVRSICGLTQIP